jgi:hypothetical protein
MNAMIMAFLTGVGHWRIAARRLLALATTFPA